MRQSILVAIGRKGGKGVADRPGARQRFHISQGEVVARNRETKNLLEFPAHVHGDALVRSREKVLVSCVACHMDAAGSDIGHEKPMSTNHKERRTKPINAHPSAILRRAIPTFTSALGAEAIQRHAFSLAAIVAFMSFERSASV